MSQVASRDDELRILNSIAEALNRSPTVQAALERTLDQVAALLGLRTGWIWLLDAETGQFYSAAARELPPYLQEPVRMAGVPCWCIESFLQHRLTPANIRLIHCSRLYPAIEANQAAETGGLSCHASIPLAFGDRLLGIINVTAPEWRELTPQELRLLSTIAYQVGIAVERARLAEEATRLARVEERARLARELHDTLAQGLAAIGLQIESGLHHLETDTSRARERLQAALRTAERSLAEARASLFELRPAPLLGRRLREALGELARGFTAETGIRIQVQSLDLELAPEVEQELFRIAQEALANVRRHSGATEARITLDRFRGGARLWIGDNGRGISASGATRGTAQGIAGMRERARLIGGRLRVTSRPGRGVRVSVELPRAESGP
jgi:two-component system NarL family sensor kinase